MASMPDFLKDETAKLREYHFSEKIAMRTQCEKQQAYPKCMKAQIAKHLQNDMKELLLIQSVSSVDKCLNWKSQV